jgi:hypothetical protein
MVALLFLALGSVAAAQKLGGAKSAAPPSGSLREEARRVSAPRPLTLYYYSLDGNGLKSFEQHAGQMTVIAPQSFWVDGEGFVHGQVPAQIPARARRAKRSIS